MIEIALQGAAARGRQPVLGLGDAAGERLAARDVLRLLELAGVHAQVAVGRLEERLQLVEGQRVVHRQRAHDAEPDRKSTRLNSSHSQISYAVFCLKKKKTMFTSAALYVN